MASLQSTWPPLYKDDEHLGLHSSTISEVLVDPSSHPILALIPAELFASPSKRV
ncbi:hypothetical protein PGTUg99_028077 [Puccinia graminis f. sp. tritici]|uniref:Uncharacterized protein n=1 Tax=Puccinia graminis f. sp. tritici TaxID=56615 RepID=A0A5B0SCP4_PUCGR|nr:hypothetical protein PGTUg99_028077 [Puccinia graminis f. sp. tritici]